MPNMKPHPRWCDFVLGFFPSPSNELWEVFIKYFYILLNYYYLYLIQYIQPAGISWESRTRGRGTGIRWVWVWGSQKCPSGHPCQSLRTVMRLFSGRVAFWKGDACLLYNCTFSYVGSTDTLMLKTQKMWLKFMMPVECRIYHPFHWVRVAFCFLLCFAEETIMCANIIGAIWSLTVLL